MQQAEAISNIDVQAQLIADQWISQFGKDTIINFLSKYHDYSAFQNDPVRFGQEIFGEDYTADVKRMMESVRDFPVTIAKSANATGKTHAAARVACWFFKTFDDAQVYTAAAPPEDNLKRLLWGEIGSLLQKHKTVFDGFKQNVLHLERDPRSFLTGVAIPVAGDSAIRQAKFSGKHAPHLLFIIDEADAVPDEIFKGIESCMSGGHVRLLCMFNPRAMSGPVYRMERDGMANVVELSAFNHPNVVTGEIQIPGAVDRETTCRRVNQWTRKLAETEIQDDECFSLPNFLVGHEALSQSGKKYQPLQPGVYKITNSAFSYMVLGKYPAVGADQLINREWINSARARWDLYVAKFGEVPPNGSTGIMGFDVAEFGNDLTRACFRYGGYVDRFTGWGGVDMMETGDRGSLEYHKRRSIGACAVDGNGVGAGVAPHMRRLGCNAYGIKSQEKATEAGTEQGEFGLLRDQLWWSVREWLRLDTSAMLPPDEELIEELTAATYEVKDSKKIKIMDKDTMRELIKRSPNSADALCLTFAPDVTTARRMMPSLVKPPKKRAYAW